MPSGKGKDRRRTLAPTAGARSTPSGPGPRSGKTSPLPETTASATTTTLGDILRQQGAGDGPMPAALRRSPENASSTSPPPSRPASLTPEMEEMRRQVEEHQAAAAKKKELEERAAKQRAMMREALLQQQRAAVLQATAANDRLAPSPRGAAEEAPEEEPSTPIVLRMARAQFKPVKRKKPSPPAAPASPPTMGTDGSSSGFDTTARSLSTLSGTTGSAKRTGSTRGRGAAAQPIDDPGPERPPASRSPVPLPPITASRQSTQHLLGSPDEPKALSPTERADHAARGRNALSQLGVLNRIIDSRHCLSAAGRARLKALLADVLDVWVELPSKPTTTATSGQREVSTAELDAVLKAATELPEHYADALWWQRARVEADLAALQADIRHSLLSGRVGIVDHAGFIDSVAGAAKDRRVRRAPRSHAEDSRGAATSRTASLPPIAGARGAHDAHTARRPPVVGVGLSRLVSLPW